MQKFKNQLLFVTVSILVFTWSCGVSDRTTNDINNLTFETDSVIFDTVFTTVGSATEVFVFYNEGDENLLVEEIFLAGGQFSPYALNIDGVSGHNFKEISILPGDSLFAFVEVLIDPNNVTTPFVVKDSIIFKSDKVQKDVKLISWGQNAYFHYGDTILTNTTWESDKPHVLFGEVIVGAGATLTINECTQIYGYSFSRLNIARNSALRVLGTVDCPVIFQGHRKEERYAEEPGQWIGIRLLPGASQSLIQHAIIKNGFRGVQVDSMPVSREPNMILQNTTITNMNLVCLLGYTASIQAVNCEFLNSCEYLMVGELGGKYNFAYCTFGNFQLGCVRSTPSVYLSNADYVDLNEVEFVNPLQYDIVNCIIYGSQEEELGFNFGGKGDVTATVGHSLIRTQISDYDVNNNIINQDPLFQNPSRLNYELDSLSPAIGKATPIGNVNTDYFLKLRDANSPDIGAFENQQ
ncbi:MAG: hypothetical protein JXQ87_13330 [Bacteroidia bacterium]